MALRPDRIYRTGVIEPFDRRYDFSVGVRQRWNEWAVGPTGRPPSMPQAARCPVCPPCAARMQTQSQRQTVTVTPPPRAKVPQVRAPSKPNIAIQTPALQVAAAKSASGAIVSAGKITNAVERKLASITAAASSVAQAAAKPAVSSIAIGPTALIDVAKPLPSNTAFAPSVKPASAAVVTPSITTVMRPLSVIPTAPVGTMVPVRMVPPNQSAAAMQASAAKPASGVFSTIGSMMSSVAQKLGLTTAPMTNAATAVARPAMATIQAGPKKNAVLPTVSMALTTKVTK